MRRCLLAVTLVACHGADGAAAPTAPPPATTPSGGHAPGTASAGHAAPAAPCVALPFAADSPLPEASAAAFLTVDGRRVLMVVSDSGNHGAYELLDPDDGKVREQGKLQLGPTSDDLEGLARDGDRMIGLTSAGWVYAWRRAGAGFELADGPYPLGPVDEAQPLNGGMGDKPPKGDGMVCGARGVNCGRNYEGLCLARAPRGGLAGFALAKADGHLYGLRRDEGGGLTVDRTAAIRVGRPGAIADCAFADDDTLWIGANMFGLNQVSRVDGWEAPAKAKVVPLDTIGAGFSEGLAVSGDVVYRFSDTGGAPSLMAKFRCAGPAR